MIINFQHKGVDMVAKLDVQYYYRKGFYSGLPEDCYPDEEDFDYQIKRFYTANSKRTDKFTYKELEESFENEYNEEDLLRKYLEERENV